MKVCIRGKQSLTSFTHKHARAALVKQTRIVVGKARPHVEQQGDLRKRALSNRITIGITDLLGVPDLMQRRLLYVFRNYASRCFRILSSAHSHYA